MVRVRVAATSAPPQSSVGRWEVEAKRLVLNAWGSEEPWREAVPGGQASEQWRCQDGAVSVLPHREKSTACCRTESSGGACLAARSERTVLMEKAAAPATAMRTEERDGSVPTALAEVRPVDRTTLREPTVIRPSAPHYPEARRWPRIVHASPEVVSTVATWKTT